MCNVICISRWKCGLRWSFYTQVSQFWWVSALNLLVSFFWNASLWYRAHGAAKWFVSKESNRRFQPLIRTHVHRTLTLPHFPNINVTSSMGYMERLRFLPHPWLHHQCTIINALDRTFTLPSPPPAPSSMYHHQPVTRNVYASFPTPGSIINVTSSSMRYKERLRFLPHPRLHYQCNIINALRGTFMLPSPPLAPSSM